MNATDLQKYMALLLQLYALQDRFRNDPPDDPEEYLALAAEIAALSNEVLAIVNAGKITPADIHAAHARNQQTWGGEHGGGGDREEIYGIAFPTPIPSNAELFARGFVSTDIAYPSDDGSTYVVMRRGDHPPAGYGRPHRLDGK